jgi:uncharacterized protein
LVELYPLHKVREIHISGGSWDTSNDDKGRKIRRDTHDAAVPEEVFQLLQKMIPQCPQVKYVVLEQLGTSLKSPESRMLFYKDFCRMEKIVNMADMAGKSDFIDPFLPATPLGLGPIVEDEELHLQQLLLSSILEESPDYNEAIRRLQRSPLSNSTWNIENWDPAMVETAWKITQKWKSE